MERRRREDEEKMGRRRREDEEKMGRRWREDGEKMRLGLGSCLVALFEASYHFKKH